MADDQETKVTTDSLADKVGRLKNQVVADEKAVSDATANFAKVMKSGDVDAALVVADERGKAQATLARSKSQLGTAEGAVKSATYAANVTQIADICLAIGKDEGVGRRFVSLEALGVNEVKLTRSEETGKILVDPKGPNVKRARGSGNSTGSRGEPLTVDGTEYASASEANRAFFPDSGPLNRSSIVSKLVNAGHEVS